MGRKGKRPQRFSAVTAVKDKARREIGQPPPARILPAKTPERAAAKYRPTLAGTLAAAHSESD